MGKTKQAGNQLQIGRENMPIFTMQEEKLFAPEVFAEQVQQLTEQVQQSVAYNKAEVPDTLALYREKTAEMKDTAKLGSISIKGKKSVRQAKNEKIRSGRKLTEAGTADCTYLSGTVPLYTTDVYERQHPSEF